MEVRRINMWSGPRNVSTALMYSFASRPDTQACDEPLYAHYLRVTNADHPGKEAVMASQNPEGEAVVKDLILGPCERPVLFCKQMAHHLVALDESFLRHTRHILLIRHPAAVITSFAKVIPHPVLRDIGIARLYEIAATLESVGITPAVVEGNELLKNPGQVLREVCRQMDIPFYPEMLSWPAGPKAEDGVWAPYWYAQVHQSTGFQAWKPDTTEVPPGLEPLLAEALPYYEALWKKAIRAT